MERCIFGGSQTCLEKACLEETCANGQVHLHSEHEDRYYMDLARDTYSTVHVLIGARSVPSGGFYFVCDHGKRRSAKQYNLGCNLFPSPPCPKSYTQTRIVQQQHNHCTISSHEQSITPHLRKRWARSWSPGSSRPERALQRLNVPKREIREQVHFQLTHFRFCVGMGLRRTHLLSHSQVTFGPPQSSMFLPDPPFSDPPLGDGEQKSES